MSFYYDDCGKRGKSEIWRGWKMKKWREWGSIALAVLLLYSCGGQVGNLPPRGVLTAQVISQPSDIAGPVGVKVQFTARYFDPDGGKVEARLEFGDGQSDLFPATDTSLTHLYLNEGTYQPRLVLTDDDTTPPIPIYVWVNGDQSFEIVVSNRTPVVQIKATPTYGTAPLAVIFDGTGSYDPDGGRILLYQWDFDCGDPCNFATDQEGPTASHTYEADGIYNAALRVQDDEYQTAIAIQKIRVGINPPPKAVVNATPMDGYAPLTVTLDGSGSFDPDGGVITLYEWDFDYDGVSFTPDAFGQTVTFTYNTTLNFQNFTAALRVTDDDAPPGTDIETVVITVRKNPPPVASFTASPFSGFAPLEVNFDASGSYDPDGGNLVLYEWDFDYDGTFNTDQTGIAASNEYSTSNNFRAALRVTDDEGLTTLAEKLVYVGGNPPPIAMASCAPTYGISPLNVTCSGSGSFDPDETNRIVTYSWDFGDNSPPATGVTVSHRYVSTAPSIVFVVTLTVTDDEGLTDSEIVRITVGGNPPPVAIIEATPTWGDAPLTVSFDGRKSFDPDATNIILSYEWDFTDDGIFDFAGQIASFRYDANGVYTARLRVTDDEGNQDEDTIQIYVGVNPPPVAVISVSPTTGFAPLTVTFDASRSYDPDDGTTPGAGITSYSWDLDNDGSFETPGAVVTRTYDGGTHIVWLMLTDAAVEGNVTIENVVITVIANPPPVAQIICSPVFGDAPLTVVCHGANSYDPDATNVITDYSWDFGDTSVGTGILVSHTYLSEGVYTVTLTVTDDEGNTDDESAIISVGENPPPVAVATASPTWGIPPLKVTFDASRSFDPDNTNRITAYAWDFDSNVSPGVDDSSVTAVWEYLTPGPYVVELTVWDDEGLNDVVTLTIFVGMNPPPVAVIDVPVTVCTAPCTLTFHGGNSFDPDDGTTPGIGITDYAWTLDGGTPRSGSTVVYEFDLADAGLHLVTLQVTDNDDTVTGGPFSDAESVVIRILANPPPVAEISCTPTYSNAPFSFTCFGSNSYDPDTTNVITDYAWSASFISGSGTITPASGTGVLYTASVSADSSGVIGVTLVVTDDEGLTDDETVNINVGPNPPPIAVATATPGFCTAPCNVVLSGSDSYDPDETNRIEAYSWTVSGPDTNCSPNSSTDSTFTLFCNSSAAGVYTADLEVTDDEGLTDTVSVSVYINVNPPPVAVITADSTVCMLSGVSVECSLRFDGGNSYDPDDGTQPGIGIVSYNWVNLEDGEAKRGATVTYTFETAGEWPVTLTVGDNDGLSDAETIWVKILGNPDPVAIASCTPTYGDAPLKVTCTGAESYDPDQTNIITNYEWDFGDGSGVFTGILVSHEYVAAGVYTVTLTVTDDEGNTDEEFVVINVGPNPPPIAVATATPGFCTAPCNVVLSGSDSYDPDETNRIEAYSWTVSGPDTNCSPNSSTDSTFTLFCNSSAAGVYTADLEVTDDEGLTDTVSVSVYINVNPPPVAVIGAPFTTCMLSGPANECTLEFRGGNSYDPDEGMPPAPGQGITAYSWDVECDGSTDLTGQTITWTFDSAGAHCVALTVDDNDGNSDAETIWVKILGNPDPVADISCSPTFGTAPFSFTCSGADSRDPDATNVITNYSWTIDETNLTSGSVTPLSGTGILFTATFSDDAEGYIIVELEVTDDESNTDTERAIINVGANPPPVAVATATPGFCQAPCDIVLDGTGSYDPDESNVITAYSWTVTGPDTNCAPATSSSSAFTLHCNSNAAGVYDAELEVTDNETLTDTVTVSVYINVNPPPVAILNLNTDVCIISGSPTTCTINANASDSYDPDNGTNAGAGISLWEYTCDNGTLPFTPDADGIFTCTYTVAGTYLITVRVTEDDTSAQTDTASQFVTVLANPPPVAVIESDRTQGNEPLTVAFTGLSSYDPDATNVIVSYEWDFNDTGTGPEDPADCTDVDSTDASPQNTFDEVGTYLVCLTVTDDEGLTHTATMMIIVGGSDIPPVSVFSASPTFGNAPLTVQFDGNASYDPDNANPQAGITCWEWDFNSDQNYSDPGENGGTCPNTTQLISYTYTAPGTYVVTLRVTDDEGSTDTSTMFISVDVNPPPIAVLSASPTEGELKQRDGDPNLELPVTFNACDSDDPDNPGSNDGITNYEWDFNGNGNFMDSAGTEWTGTNEGSSGTTCSVSIEYILAGTYVVTVRVSDDDSPPNTDTATIFITVRSNPPPIAVLEASPTFGNAPLTVTFSAYNSRDPDETDVIVQYDYDFGDTTLCIDCGVLAVHTYTGAGIYTAELTVTDDEGLTDTEKVTISVDANPPPIAVATATPGFCTAPCNIVLDASGSYDPDDTDVIEVYQWAITPGTGVTAPSGVEVPGPLTHDCSATSDPVSFTANFDETATGVYTAELRVCDDEGLDDTVSVSVYINVNPPPIAKFTCDYTTFITPATITCDGSASYDPDDGTSPGAGIVSYQWDFTCSDFGPSAAPHPNLGGDDDGTTECTTLETAGGDFEEDPNESGDSEGAKTGAIATFTYKEPGVYQIFLRVVDNEGNEDFEHITVTARDQPPTATIDVDPVACSAGPSVPCTFTLRANNSKDPDNETLVAALYEWDFDYPNPLNYDDPYHITNLDFCYKAGTPFTADATGVEVQFQTSSHGIHVIALRVTDNDDQPWANDPDNDADSGQDNHACAAVSVLVKNPDFPPTAKVDVVRELQDWGRNAPYPEGTDNPPPDWDPNDQAIPNDDEFLANPANCAANDPGCVQLAVWIEDAQNLGGTLTVMIDWDEDGDETTENFEYGLCTLDPAVDGDVASASNTANATTCGPHPTLNPDIDFNAGYSFVGDNGVTYTGPPLHPYNTSGRHHIIVRVCDSANPADPNTNCSEADKTIEALKLHPAVEINYDLSDCEDPSPGNESASLDSTCVANFSVLWNDPDGPALGTDCPTCFVEVDCDFSDANGNNNGTLEWPDHLGNLGDFTADFSSDQTGETDHTESDPTCTYTDPNRNSYIVVTRFLDDDQPEANIATATTTLVIRSDPPTIEIVHSEDDTDFDPDGGYDGNDDLVGNPATSWFFPTCADDSDDGAYADAYGPAGGGSDATGKWIFWNYDALPGPDGNDPVGSPFGYGDDDLVAGPGFDGSVFATCVTISVPPDIYDNQGRYVFHVRVLDDECHMMPGPGDCDEDDNGEPEPNAAGVQVGVNASDAWLTLIIVDEPPVVTCVLRSDSVQGLGEALPYINTYLLNCEAEDPDGGPVTLDLNVDFNKNPAEDLADTYNPYGGLITLPFDPTNDAECADDLNATGPNGYPQDWDSALLGGPWTNSFGVTWSYDEAGKYCIVVRATDDEGDTEDHILQVNVVDEPPKLEAQVIDTNNPVTGGPPDELDAVAPVNMNWWIRINADDPDGIYSPSAFDSVRVSCPTIDPDGIGPFDSGPIPYPGFPIDVQIDGDNETPPPDPVVDVGQHICNVSYTDDDSADGTPNTTTIQVTLTVWESIPTIDAQVWDDNDNDTDPRDCDRAGVAGDQTQNRYCRDAFADPGLAGRFFSFYVRADDEDGFANSPGAQSISVSCPTIDTDPGPGVSPLFQTVVGPTFTVTSPAPEAFTNTERIDLDFDTTDVPVPTAATADQAGQHTCDITYTDDEGDTETIQVTIVILGNTLPTALIDVRPEATNPPAIFQPVGLRRASSGFDDDNQTTGPYSNRFVFRASAFDQDENQDDTPCPGVGCAFTFEWDLNNDGSFETPTAGDNEVSVIYCDNFVTGNLAGNNWSATAGNADPGVPGICGNNGTPDQKEIKVGVRVTDDEGAQKEAWMTIALHDDPPWAEIDVDNTGANDLLVAPDDSAGVDFQFNGNDPDSPGGLFSYSFECGDVDGAEAFGTFTGGVSVAVNITYGPAASACTVASGSSATGTLTITDSEGNSITATVTIGVIGTMPPAGLEIHTDVGGTNPITDLNTCFAPCLVNATAEWEDDALPGTRQFTSWDWNDGVVEGPIAVVGAAGAHSRSHSYEHPGNFLIVATFQDNDGNISTASTRLIVLDRAPSADIDVENLGGPVGSPGPDVDPRDNANALIVNVNDSVSVRIDLNAAGTDPDDDTFDYEYNNTAGVPGDYDGDVDADPDNGTTGNGADDFDPPLELDRWTINWFCDTDGDGSLDQTQTGGITFTCGPLTGGGQHRLLLRIGDDERGDLENDGTAPSATGPDEDPDYAQPFGLCGGETDPVVCPGSVYTPQPWNNDNWSSEAEIFIVVKDNPPGAYILEDGVGSPAGCPDASTTAGCPTPSLDDFSGHLDTSTTYTVDLRAYGVDADATYDLAGNPVSTPPLDRLIDCTDDTIWDSRFADQTTNLFDFTNFCTYTAPGSYNLRIRNITDLNDTDPTNIPGAQADATVSIVILDIDPSAYIMVDTDPADPDNDGDASNLNGVVPPNFSVTLRAHGVDPDVHFGRPGVGDGDYGANTDDSFNRGVTSTWAVAPDGACVPSPGDTTTCTWSTTGVKTITLTNTESIISGTDNDATATIVAVVFEWDPDANLCKDADPLLPGCQIDPSILFGPPPLSVPLEAQASDIDDSVPTPITDYSWDCTYDGTFNGVSSGTTNTFTCSYDACPDPLDPLAPKFIIALRVTDDEGSTAWSMDSVVCFDKPPSADIDEDVGSTGLDKAENWNNPLWLYATGGPGNPITLSGMGADEGAGANNNAYCTWQTDSPDLSPDVDPTPDELCSFLVPDPEEFECTVAGYYEVTLTTEDDEDADLGTTGNQSQSRYPVVCYDYDPTISIKAAENAEGCPSPDDPNPTELVNGFNGFDSDGNPLTPDAFCFFTDNLSNPDGDPTTINVDWDFDWSDALASGGNNDGVLNQLDFNVDASGLTATNTYGAVGQYRVASQATDSTGNTSFAHLTVEVNDGQSDGKPSDPYVNLNCQETPPVDPTVPLPFPPCPADDPTCVTRRPTLVDLTPAVFVCDAFADDPDDRTLGHQDPNGPDMPSSPHQSEEDGDPAGPDIVKYCWYIWEVTNAKQKPFDPHQNPIADCDNEIVPDLDDLDMRTPTLRFTSTGSYYLEVHVFDEGNADTDNWCDLDVTVNTPCVDGNCDTEVLTAPETNCAVGSITILVTEARPACALEKVDPTYGWPYGVGGFTTEVIGASACLPPGPQNVGFHWSFGDGAFVDDDSPPYFCFFTPELHSNPQEHTYVSPGQFYIRLAVRDEDTQAESICTATVTGTDWPLFP